MAFIRTFEGFAPPKRFDGLPFTQALIRESATIDGVYTTIDTVTLSPLDTDPANPEARDFTTANATLEDAFYIIRWTDAAAAIFDSGPIRYNDDTTSLPPSPDTIRMWSQVDFEDLGFGEDEDITFSRMVEGQTLWVSRVTGRNWADLDPDTGDPAEQWINWAMSQAVMMCTEFKAFAAQPEIIEGWADFNQISSFSAGSYSETRRTPNSRSRAIHPWTDLADLLMDLMTPEKWGALNGGEPAISVVDPSWDVGREIIDAKQNKWIGPFGPARPPWDPFP